MSLRPRKSDRLLSNSHRHAPKQEKALAKRLGGYLTVGSGNGIVKGDIKVNQIARVENKCTVAGGYTISRKLHEQISNAAMVAGEVPVYQIDFLDKEGLVTERMAVMPVWALEELINRVNG